MKKILLLTISFLFITGAKAQDNNTTYEWDWTKDGIWTGAALGATAGGFLLIQSKDGFTEAEIADIVAKQDDINFLDKWVAGNYDQDASKYSDAIFYPAFLTPAVFLFDKNAKGEGGAIAGMYLESLATTAGLFTLSAGLTNRARPYVYSDEQKMSTKLKSTATRSFYSGHTAAAATATFFTAKIYNDLHPGASELPYVWAGAAIAPAAVGYFRLQAGQHFLTDVILGYALGAGVGILVPELHKVKKDSGLSLYPTGGRTFLGDSYNGMAVSLEF